METVRFGIIGCGAISTMHASAIQRVEGAQLVGCFDAYEPCAHAFAAKYGGKVYTLLEDMLDSDALDAVCICTPSGLHTTQAVLALQAGKHVVCEKPMSLSLAQADLLIETERRTGRIVCIISQFRFAPAVQEIKRALDAGAFGKLVSASLQMKYFRSHEYYASGAWRGTWSMDGGGALMNQGIHGIDVFRFLMGPVRELTAYTRTLTRRIEVEDSAVAICEFESGAVGTIEGSTTCYPGYPRRIEICGEAGSVVLEEDTLLSWDLPIPTSLPVGEGAKNVGSADPMAISGAGHELQIRNFVRALLYGEPILAGAATGRLPLEIILGIYESSRTGKAVRLMK